jgi:hypothetical protein
VFEYGLSRYTGKTASVRAGGSATESRGSTVGCTVSILWSADAPARHPTAGLDDASGVVEDGRVRKLRIATITGVLIAAVLASMLHTGATSDPQAAAGTNGGPVRFAVVGDSLSAGRSRFLGNGLDDESWATYATGDGVEFAGGWARSGASPEMMAEHVRPVEDVDVLVILAGTNAVRLRKTLREETRSYRQIASVIRPRHVIISAIPPYRWQPRAAVEYNRDLEDLAASEGWTWADPWGFARRGSDWAAGVSVDGTHPANAEEYRLLGLQLRGIILRAVGRQPWAQG